MTYSPSFIIIQDTHTAASHSPMTVGATFEDFPFRNRISTSGVLRPPLYSRGAWTGP